MVDLSFKPSCSFKAVKIEGSNKSGVDEAGGPLKPPLLEWGTADPADYRRVQLLSCGTAICFQ